MMLYIIIPAGAVLIAVAQLLMAYGDAFRVYAPIIYYLVFIGDLALIVGLSILGIYASGVYEQKA